MKFSKMTTIEEPSPDCLLLIISLALKKLPLFEQPEFGTFSGVAFLSSTDRLMRKRIVKTNGEQAYWKIYLVSDKIVTHSVTDPLKK